MAIAGIVLFGVIDNRLASTLREEEQREPALTVFRTTAPGLNAWDIGSAFRGLATSAATCCSGACRAGRPSTERTVTPVAMAGSCGHRLFASMQASTNGG